MYMRMCRKLEDQLKEINNINEQPRSNSPLASLGAGSTSSIQNRL
jgi:hypothetical protein